MCIFFFIILGNHGLSKFSCSYKVLAFHRARTVPHEWQASGLPALQYKSIGFFPPSLISFLFHFHLLFHSYCSSFIYKDIFSFFFSLPIIFYSNNPIQPLIITIHTGSSNNNNNNAAAAAAISWDRLPMAAIYRSCFWLPTTTAFIFIYIKFIHF